MSLENHVRIKNFLDKFQPQVDEFIRETPVAELGDVVTKLTEGLGGRGFPLSINPQVVDRAYHNGIITLQAERAVMRTRYALAGSKNLQFSQDTPGPRETSHYFTLKDYNAELVVQGTPNKVIISPEWGIRGKTGLTPISLIRKTQGKFGWLQGVEYAIPLEKFEERFASVDKTLGRILGVLQQYINESQSNPGFNPHSFTAGTYRKYHVGRGI